MESSSGRDRLRISVDDSAVDQGCPQDIGRRSPEVSFRLELDGRPARTGNVSPSTTSPVAGSTGPMQKCLSFPRIVTDRSGGSSLSPCQSRLYLDACFPVTFLGDGDRAIDPDRLSIAGHAGLLRSMSARTVDSRQEADQSLNSSGSSSRYLSPAGDRINRPTLAGRSTSCPSMAYPNLTCRTSGLPAEAMNDIKHFPFRDRDVEDDINLDGEVITDLPIEPNTVFPDLPDDLGLGEDKLESRAPNKAGTLNYPGRRQSHSSLQPEVVKADDNRHGARPKQDLYSGDGSRAGPFMNIRDLTRSAAKEAMSQPRRPDDSCKVDTNEKCLRWLNTLPGHQS